MIGVYHSTAISLVSRCCPYALQLQEDGVPMDRRVFQVGIAAHAVLEGIALCTNEIGRELTEEEVKVSALGVAERLISVGRSYDGKGEPPMSPEDMFAGSELALNWTLGVEPMQPGAMLEQGLGLDADGKPTEYWKGSGLTIRTILDSVRIVTESDEESSRRVIVVRDYKTAWTADADELETLQRRIQAVAAWRYFGPADVLRLEIVNLRLQKVYAKDLYAADGLEEQIAEWWRQVSTTVRALEAQRKIGRRPAAPGVGCLRCPFVQRCEHAKDFIERRGMHQTDEQRALAYTVATAMRDDLAEELRVATEENPIPVPGGSVGYTPKTRMKLTPDASGELWTLWEDSGGEPEGFVKALQLSKTNAEKALKVLYPERGQRKDRDDALVLWTEPETVKEFGAWPEEKS